MQLTTSELRELIEIYASKLGKNKDGGEEAAKVDLGSDPKDKLRDLIVTISHEMLLFLSRRVGPLAKKDSLRPDQVELRLALRFSSL